MKALIYCRVSSQKQVTEGDGLQSQEMRCVNYALNKGYTIEKIFRDPGISGGGDFIKRPAMMEILAYLDSHPTEQYVIVFDDLKRFARDTEFHIKLRTALKVRKAVPECLNYNFDDSPEGRFTETIFAAQAQLEREQNREQVINKQKARLERGYAVFCPPMGLEYRKDPEHGKLLFPIEPKALIIKEALEGFSKGIFFTQKDVRDFLNKQKLKTTPISFEGVKRILTQPLYAGLIEYLPWSVERRQGHHKGIISVETFEMIEERLNGHTRKLDREDEREEFPLRRFVACEYCSISITASWSTGRTNKYPYYRCKTKGCMGSIRKEDLENDFTSLLSQTTPTKGILKLFKHVFTEEAEALEKVSLINGQEREKKIHTLEKEIDAVTNLAIKTTSDVTRKVYEKKLETLQNELDSYLESSSKNNHEKNVGTILQRGYDILKNPMDIWTNGNLKDRKMIQTIVFHKSPTYSKENKFGTAEYSLLYKVLTTSIRDESRLVDLVRNNWNQLNEELRIVDQYLLARAL